MLMAWRETVPQQGTEKKALDFLPATFCINLISFLGKKKRHKDNCKVKIAKLVYSAKLKIISMRSQWEKC